MVVAAVAAVVASWAFSVLVHLVWRPHAISRKLRAQGMHGPGYRFCTGNLDDIKRLRAEGAGVTLDVGDHDFIPMVQPHFRKWISLYGMSPAGGCCSSSISIDQSRRCIIPSVSSMVMIIDRMMILCAGRTFVYWTGARPNVGVADVNVVKQVLSDRTGLYPKILLNPHISRLLGNGLVFTDGDDWKRHRKVVHPAFSMDKLKMMTVTMSNCTQSMMSEWEAQLAKGGDVEVELSSRFEELTADVISHTAFGSSYVQGKKVFLAQRELQLLAFSTIFDVQIPGFRYLPTEKNLKTWKLDKQVRGMLMDIIKTRLAAKDTAGYGNDLLGLMLEACAPEHGETPLLSMDEIIDECKTFFFAGHDTTSHLLTWAAFLLSTHPEWQDRLREEVRRECGDEVPTGDTLNKLKEVNMFLLETLRLYAPVSTIVRSVSSDLDLGGIQVPEGTILTIPIATIHRDKDVWGEDAGEFRPKRFENGVTRAAKHPNALLSFSSGPRSCIGQNFAMIEAKTVVAMILRRFSLELPPKYVHAPMDVITLRARHGLPMLLKRLEA
jgi:PHYB activation tagged suppressor 1